MEWVGGDAVMDFDPNSAATGGASVGGLAWLYFFFRKLMRGDAKDAAVDSGWHSIIAGLREEIKHLRESIVELTIKVDTCELERGKLQSMIASFERRYGMRKEGQAE